MIYLLFFYTVAVMIIIAGTFMVFGLVFALLRVETKEGRRFIRDELHLGGIYGIPLLTYYVMFGGDMKSGDHLADRVYYLARRSMLFFVVMVISLRAIDAVGHLHILNS